MYVASERKELVRGICLLNCVGGMNQRGLYKDSRTLAVMRPLIEIFEVLLKNKSVAAWVFSKFRCFYHSLLSRLFWLGEKLLYVAF